MNQIPLVNLKRQYEYLKQEIQIAINDTLDSCHYINNERVRQFSQEFAQLHDCSYGLGCSNGTAALQLALEALKIEKGAEVIVPVNTFIASAEAIVLNGLKPVFVDIDPKSYLLSVDDLSKKVNDRTKAIMPVHLYGNHVPMEPLIELNNKFKQIYLIEDCAQAHLSSYRKKMVGSHGVISAFSFYPGKNLGAYGDAGIVITNDEKYYEYMKASLNHGRQDKYYHQFSGNNLRMDELQAAILSVKLKYLKKWSERRREIAKQYDEVFLNRGFKVAQQTPESETVYHLYIVEVSNRDEVQSKLKNQGIISGVHYPVPLHLQPAFGYLGYKKGDFPHAEKTSNRILSLPMCPELTDKEQQIIIETFLKFAGL